MSDTNQPQGPEIPDLIVFDPLATSDMIQNLHSFTSYINAEHRKYVQNLQREIDELIKQRDAAEECINEMFFAVTGEDPEWTNAYGYQEALEDVREQTLGWQESSYVMAGKVNELSENIASRQKSSRD